MSQVFDPFNPYGEPAPVAKTVHEVACEALLAEALPYLAGLAAWQPSEKLESLIGRLRAEVNR